MYVSIFHCYKTDPTLTIIDFQPHLNPVEFLKTHDDAVKLISR